jgi:single-strand DNA-binding protein
MAGSLNKILLIGNLGHDPELKFTPNGSAVCNFSIATSENWKDKEGNKKIDTQWHRITVWGKSAESCGEYLKKGSSVCVEGKIKTRSYEDKQGVKKYVTDIIADHVTFLSCKNNEAATHDEQQPGSDEVPF